MKTHQLIGRKKVAAAHKKTPQYPLLHIHSFPYEILTRIVRCLGLDRALLLLLGLVCVKFNNLVSKHFLYDLMTFSAVTFVRFAQLHLPKSLLIRFGNEPSARINFMRLVHLVNPPVMTNPRAENLIAGTYHLGTVDSKLQEKYLAFVGMLKSLLSEAYGLKEIRVSEILPHFEFPSEYLKNKTMWLRPRKPIRLLEKVVLASQSGWSILFKPTLILLFVHIYDRIDILELQNFVLTDKLDTFPKVAISTLVSNSCKYEKRKFAQQQIWAETESLLLLNIQNGHDLSLIDQVKVNGKLRSLEIDIGLLIFFHMEGQKKRFNFGKYNNLFKLLCLGQGGYSGITTITLVNFDLFDSEPHKHLEAISEEEPVNNLEAFLKSLCVREVILVMKNAPKVVNTCVKCGFQEEAQTRDISTLRPNEWAILLHPIPQECTVWIYSHKRELLHLRRNTP